MDESMCESFWLRPLSHLKICFGHFSCALITHARLVANENHEENAPPQQWKQV